MTWALIILGLGVTLAGWAVLIAATSARMARAAELRALAAEQHAAEHVRDADARVDRAIELWNDERAEHSRDLETVRVQLDILREQAITTVAQYRHAFDQLAALVRMARDARDDDHDASGSPPTRVM